MACRVFILLRSVIPSSPVVGLGWNEQKQHYLQYPNSLLWGCLLVLSLAFFVPSDIFAASRDITITEVGFEPSELQIKQGDSVVFRNGGSQEHWPASDPHPTHHFFKQFDPKSAIAPGKSWQMTFGQAGTFAFHDHLFPHSKGVITVVEDSADKILLIKELGTDRTRKLFDPLSRLLAKIAYPFRHAFDTKQKPNPSPVQLKALTEQEQYAYLKTFISKNGSAATWQLIQKTFQNDAGLSSNVHDIAHYVGGLLYTKEGFPGLSICTTEFSFGCFHGFLDMAFRNDLSRLQDAVLGCAKLGTVVTGPYSSCIHGIGHGVASFYRVKDLDASLQACEGISNGAPFCYDGVFMEFSRNAAKTFYKPEDNLYPCNAVDEKYIFSCGRNQPSVLLGRFSLQFADAANVCAQAIDESFRLSCIDAIGFIATSRSFGDANKIISDCKTISEEQYFARCAEKAAGELIFQNHPDWRQASFAVCAQLPQAYQTNCSDYLQTIIREYRIPGYLRNGGSIDH